MQLSILATNGLNQTLAKQSEEAVWSSMGIEPRSWQADALPIAMTAIQKQWSYPRYSDDAPRPLIQAVMGSGKSIFLSGVVKATLDMTSDTIVVTAPRRMLVAQLANTLSGFLPPGTVGRYYGDIKQPSRRVIVACDASAIKLAKSLQRQGREVALWLADECHGSEADRIKDWVGAIAPHARIGLTATPRRASKKEALTLWTEELYRYDAAAALADGVVVPFNLRHWHGDPETELDDAMFELIQQIVGERLGPGVVDANNIDDAVVWCKRLNDSGIKAACVHSRMPYEDTQRTLRGLRDRYFDVVVHVSILKEGVDMPWLRWLGLRRQISSPVYFAQYAGRVLRAHEGKESAEILDPGNLFAKHKLNLEAVLECDVEQGPKLVVIEGGKGKGGGRTPTTADEVEPVYAVTMSNDVSELQRLFVGLETKGWVKRGYGGTWRNMPASEKQLGVLESASRKPNIKQVLRSHPNVEMFRRLYARRNELTKGQMSDLLSVIFGLAKRGRR